MTSLIKTVIMMIVLSIAPVSFVINGLNAAPVGQHNGYIGERHNRLEQHIKDIESGKYKPGCLLCEKIESAK